METALETILLNHLLRLILIFTYGFWHLVHAFDGVVDHGDFVDFLKTINSINGEWCIWLSHFKLITVLIAESTKPSFVAFASIVRHTNSMSAWFSAVSNHSHMKLMANFNFTMISTKTIQASTFIDTITFATVHAWDDTFGWKTT